MEPPFVCSTISDFGERIVVHRAGTDPNDHKNIYMALGDIWESDPISAERFAANLVSLLNKAEYEPNEN